MEHRRITPNPSRSATPRPSEMGEVNPFSCGVMFCRRPSMDSIRIAESHDQGTRSQPVSVEVTVLRARNVPHIKATFSGKREFFVTIAYGAATKTKKQTKRRTKSVQIDGQTVMWDQRLDAFFVQPSSHLTLCLYAKRLTKSDLLIGTHEMVIPVGSESDISFVLSHSNGQAESTPPVTLDLTITVSGNRTSRSDPQTIPTEGDDIPAEDVRRPTVATNSREPDQSTAPEHPLLRSDHPPAEIGTPVPQDLETSLVEKARK
ncbi:hypothetical protein EDB85DRAFT_2276299, partial [Lactarius pseudohatsudake]